MRYLYRLSAAFCLLGLLAAPEAFALDDVTIIPWVAQAPGIPHDSYNGQTTHFKAVARGLVGSARYEWDFGDSSSSGVLNANKVSNNEFADLHSSHAFAAQASDRLFIATVYACDTGIDGANCDPHQGLSAQYKIQIHEPVSRSVRVNKAIDDALWMLHRSWKRRANANPDARQAYTSAGDHWAATSVECQAFEIQGHTLAVSEALDPYVTDVKQCVNELTAGLTARNITGLQRGQNADLNGNAIGFYTTNNAYKDGMVLMALASTGDPDYVAMTGNATWVLGRSLRDIAQDYAEHFYWGQAESSIGVIDGIAQYRGGWNYAPNNSGGNSGEGSTNQWPVLGIEAAHANYDVPIPEWVKQDQENWLDYDQVDGGGADGGLGYRYATQYTNLAKTAAGIAAGAFVGLEADGDLPPGYQAGHGMSMKRAWGYIHRLWTAGFYSWHRYHWGSLYAMYGVKKAAYSYSETISCVSTDPGDYYKSTDACHTAGGHPWEITYSDYFTLSGQCISAYGINIACNPQGADGTWSAVNSNQAGHYNGGNRSFSTGMVVLILTPQIFEIGPVAQAAADPQQANPGDLITFDHSGSFHPASPENSIVVYRWDWDAADGLWWQDAGIPVPVDGYLPVGCTPNVDCQGYVSDCSIDPDCHTANPSHIYNDELLPGEERLHAVTLQVLDDHDPALSDIDDESVQIRISRFNHAPIARCDPSPPSAPGEPNYEGGRGSSIQLSGAASYDPDADQPEFCMGMPSDYIVSYEWDLDNDGVFDTVGEDAEFAIPIDAEVGIQYVVSLRVIDDGTWAACFPGSQDSLSATKSCLIEVIPNLPPTAVALPDDGVFECSAPGGAQVTLDGGNSSDPDVGDQISYDWSPAAGLDDPNAVAPTGFFNLGSHLFGLTVTDNFGESDSDDASFMVLDRVAPELTCENLALECAGPDGTPGDPQGSASDICDADVELSSDSPDSFPLGDTTVTWTATDGSNNSDQCLAVVQVQDSLNPLITCPADLIIEADELCLGHTPLQATASDICDAAPVITDNQQADYPLGESTVSFTATDASGNNSSCQTQVVVQDSIAPVALAGPDQLELEANAECLFEITVDGSESSDNCSIVSWSWSEAGVVLGEEALLTTTLEGVGEHSLILTVCDAAGNCSSDEVLIDITTSVMSCFLVEKVNLKLTKWSNDDGRQANGHLHIDGTFGLNECTPVEAATDAVRLSVDDEIFEIPAGGLVEVGRSGKFKYHFVGELGFDWTFEINTRKNEWKFKSRQHDTQALDPSDGLSVELLFGDQSGYEEVPVEGHGRQQKEWGYHAPHGSLCP